MTTDACPAALADVLVVDDDNSAGLLIERIVARMGHRCVRVTSGEDAVEQLAAGRFAVVITDINMPGVSGLQVLRAARENDPDVAVVVVSGVGDPGTAESALSNGAFGYVVKPFGVMELQIAVCNALRRRELEIELRRSLRGLEFEVDRRTDELRVATLDAQLQEHRFRSLAQASPLGIVYADAVGVLEYCNSNAEVLLGRNRGQLEGRRWLDELDSAGRCELAASISTAAAGGSAEPCEYLLTRPGGSEVWLRSRTAPVLDGDSLTEGVVVLFEDIGDRRDLEQKLRYQASHDHLTGLPNPREFRIQVSAQLSELASGQILAALMVDLDQFKLVNDTYGHEAGDQLIIEVGQRLSRCVPTGSTVARLGGDEFVVALTGLDRNEALDLGERIRHELRRPIFVSGIELSLGASIGIGFTSDPQTTPSTLLRKADVAMHHAKNRRDAIEVFDSTMAQNVARRLTLSSDLRRAVAQGELTVHYQPVFDAVNQELAGFEALARWTHDRWGAIGPDEFIPLAASIGIVHQIDCQILTSALTQLASWLADKQIAPDVFMSVNMSASQLSNAALPDLVDDRSGRFGRAGHISSRPVQEHRRLVAQQVEPDAVVLGRQMGPHAVRGTKRVESGVLFTEPVGEVDFAVPLWDVGGVTEQPVRKHEQPIGAQRAQSTNVGRVARNLCAWHGVSGSQ